VAGKVTVGLASYQLCVTDSELYPSIGSERYDKHVAYAAVGVRHP